MRRADDSTEASNFENGKDGHFSATHWSIVPAAGANDLTRATTALERLCRTYWFPIYPEGGSYAASEVLHLALAGWVIPPRAWIGSWRSSMRWD
jgi:hypothetical protein